MRHKTSKPQLAGSEYIGCVIAGCILLMQLVFFWHLYGPKQLSEFMGSAAASWAQAIGAVAAIFASFKLGERSFKRQMLKEEINDLAKRLHSFEVMHEVFGAANGVDILCSHIYQAPTLAKSARVAANDALQLLHSIPVMKVPQAEQVLQLNLCRQAMCSYISWADKWLIEKDPLVLRAWQDFAVEAAAQSKSAMVNCEIWAARINRKSQRLTHYL